MKADLILINGKIITMDNFNSVCEAIAIEKSYIAKIGTNHEVLQEAGNRTRIIDLRGKTVIPGLIDTHIHVADFGRFLNWMELKEAGSIKEVQESLKKRVRKTSEDKWIIGRGWDQNRFIEKRFPNASDLNEAAPCNPVIFYHSCGQLSVVNSRALELAGITKNTVAPTGGVIEKNPETGEPTGVLRETATNLIWQVIPEPTEEDLTEGAILACQKIVEAGITSVHWMASSPLEISIAKRLYASNKLPLRIFMIIPSNLISVAKSLGRGESQQEDWVRIGGVEIFADGFLASKTAALSEPYIDIVGSTSKGSLVCNGAEIVAVATETSKSGYQLIVHAMGDKAIDLALTAIEETSKKSAPQSCSPRIEQAALLNEALLERIKGLKVVVSVQPLVIDSEFSVYSAMERLGPKRARWLYPIKTLLKNKVHVIAGSDCPMEPLNPFSGIRALVTRSFFPEERLAAEEALRLYTVEAAYASSEEKTKGTIEAGKLADLVVLSENPMTIAQEKIEDIIVEMTLVGGKVVYQKPPP
jgi:predicted amidohydrolase YtcJ